MTWLSVVVVVVVVVVATYWVEGWKGEDGGRG